ncbi:GNAT family N-acetyltransferase [Streptomyces montanus]
MRPAAEDDRTAVTDLLQARDDWIRQRGLPPSDAVAVRALIGDSGDDMTLMVLAEDDEIVGSVVLYATTPSWGWTASERAEPSLGLATMYTHPAHHGGGLGRLMTLWALDYAARRTDLQLQWVRGSVHGERLMHHFRDELGWDDVRHTRDRSLQRTFQMQQRPRELPGLRALITSDDPPLATDVCTTELAPDTSRWAGQEPT